MQTYIAGAGGRALQAGIKHTYQISLKCDGLASRRGALAVVVESETHAGS